MKVLGVLGGGAMPPEVVRSWCQSADVVIAADGGLMAIEAAGCRADVVLGDFDSAPADLLATYPDRIHLPSEETTDGNKLLAYAASCGYESITLIGVEGDLLDHVLDTLQTAGQFGLRVRLGLNRGLGILLTGDSSAVVDCRPGARVSLLPITRCAGASLSGVRWDFAGENLEVGGFRSISNAALGGPVRATIGAGSAFFFAEREPGAGWDF